MFVAVALASLNTISLSLTKHCAKIPARMVKRKNRPAILASSFGEASLTFAVIYFSSLGERFQSSGCWANGTDFRRRLQSPSTERTKEKNATTPSAIIVHTQK